MSGFDVDLGEDNHLGLGPLPGQGFGGDAYNDLDNNRDSWSTHQQQRPQPVPQEPSRMVDAPPQTSQRAGTSENGDAQAQTPTNLYISNLTWWTTDAQLEALCNEHGQLLSLKFAEDRATGKSKGTATAEFATRDAAERCQDALQGHSINGKPCTASLTAPSMRPAPPPGRGGPPGGPPPGPRPPGGRFQGPREGGGRDEMRGRERGMFGGDRGGMQGGPMGMPPVPNPLGMPGMPGMMMGGMPGMMMGMGGMPPVPGMGMGGMMPLPGGMPFPMDEDGMDERRGLRDRRDSDEGYQDRDFDRDTFKHARY